MKLQVVLTIVLVIFAIQGCGGPQREAKVQLSVSSPQFSEEKTQELPAMGGTASKPQIKITNTVYDFGPMSPGTKSKAVFDFKNVGTGTLEIYGVNCSCGFFPPPTFIKDGVKYRPVTKDNPLVLESGESARVEVRFTAPWSKRISKKSLWLLSNDPDNPRAQIEIMAEVIAKVEVSPEQVDLLLDQVNGGMKEIVLESVDGRKFSIQEITVSDSVMTIPFDSEKRAKQFTLIPEVDIEKLAHSPDGVIRIVTDHPNGDKPIIRYKALPYYEVSSPRYILQNLEPGKSIFRDNRIKSNYGKKAEIESVESKNGYMEIEEQQQDGDHIKLKIKITPPAQTSSEERYITDQMTITLKNGDKLTIRCSGWFLKRG
ncbi:MAG: DUF1573 domain-containing protein [Planctomycetota bacterium]|jgi:hypothetical protein